jgi:type I restriction enzyme S subunit
MPVTNKWETKPLGKLVEFRNGVNYNKNSFGNGIKVVGVKDFQDYIKPKYSELNQIDPRGIVTEKNILHHGDIVFVRSNGNRDLIGRSLFIDNPPEPVTHSAFTIRLRFTTKEIDPRFYAYLLRSPLIRKSMTAFGGGTNISNLNQDILYQLAVPYPPYLIQQQISKILSAYDDLIENNERRIKILEEMARSLYREWFVYFRYPGHVTVPLVNSSLGPIPKGWEVFPLEMVCDRITDGSHFSPKSVETGYPMASVKDMTDWGFEIGGCRRINEKDFNELVRNDCKPKRNDVLIAKDGSYLKHTFVVTEEMDLVILSSIAILRPNKRIRSNFLNFLLRDPNIKARMEGFVSGVALPRIILKEFRQFLIVLPPKNLQEKWANIADPIIELCMCLIRQNTQLRKTRDLLLPRLLSGQISLDVKVTNA